MDDPQKLLYHSLIAMAQGGTNTAIKWIVKNPDAFLNVICGGAQLLNLLPNPPLSKTILQGANALYGIRGAQRSLPKIQAYFSKKYDTKAGVANSLNDTITGFSGRSGFELKNLKSQSSRNKPAVIDEVSYSGHALDQMQNRGIPPTIVKNAIKNGTPFETQPGTIGFHDSKNNIMVIVNPEKNKVITVIRGKP